MPNTIISREEYQQFMKERDELPGKILAAESDFMEQLYKKVNRVYQQFNKRAEDLNITIQKRELRNQLDAKHGKAKAAS